MDVKWLEDFVTVARCRSFTRAATERNASQSGLSRRIRSLEQWVGVDLIDRDAFPFSLTSAGMRFLPVAVNLHRELISARNVCKGICSEPDHTPVRMAVPEGLECGALPQLLARLRATGIDTPVRVVVKAVDEGGSALLDGEVDLWLAPQHAQLPVKMDPQHIDVITVAHDRLSPIVGVDAIGRPLHSLPGTHEHATPLLEYGQIDYLGRAVSMLLDDAPQRAHLRSAYEANSLHSICALVRQGLGVAFLPESMVRDELRRGELQRADTRWSAPLEIRLARARRRAGSAAAPGGRRIWDGLRQQAAVALR